MVNNKLIDTEQPNEVLATLNGFKLKIADILKLLNETDNETQMSEELVHEIQQLEAAILKDD